MNHLLIRADAGVRIGMGHLMRCLALAHGWKSRGGQTTFITRLGSEDVFQRLSEEGFQIVALERSHPDPIDWETTSQVLAAHSATWVVLDGYHFDHDYQRHVKDAGHHLLVIDDNAHLDEYYADVVLNQNSHALDLSYRCGLDTDLLLGSHYVLLRNEFRNWRGKRRGNPEVASRILVTLGGGDPNNVTLKVVHALQQVNISGLEVVVVVGENNPHEATIQSAILNGASNFQIIRDVRDMPSWMAWADVAVSGGGSTCWELAFLGVPAVTIELADNQRELASGLQAVGVTQNFGWYEDVSSTRIAEVISDLVCSREQRTQMATRGSSLVDGMGVDRVLSRLWGCSPSLRVAHEEDAEMVWRWANDPEVRAMSLSPETIKWDSHLQWFGSKLSDPHCRFYIALNENQIPIGQIRFDIGEKEVVTDVNFDCRYRRQGYGHRIIRLASDMLCKEIGLNNIHAYVLSGNEASVKAFVKAGYQTVDNMTVRGQEVLKLIWMKETCQ